MSYERRKVRVGRVVSDKMDKTVVVVYEWRQSHSIYKKSVRRQAKFYAHDEENRCSLGDTVRIIESRPYSKTKRWKVAEILSSIEIADVQPEQIQMDEDILSASATSAALAQSEAAETDTTASVDEDILSASATSAALVQSEAAETDTTASVDEDPQRLPPVERSSNQEISGSDAADPRTQRDTRDDPDLYQIESCR
jgi:small subunit ribosomal protein S17